MRPFIRDYLVGTIQTALRNELSPMIVFVFSRRAAEEVAEDAGQLMKRRQTVPVPEDVRRFHPKLANALLPRRVAYHHAGLLPAAKAVVEERFERGEIDVLVTTETFAMGLNLPARAVIIGEWEKFDGRSLRPLKASEILQMSGRAGRRGFDTMGTVILHIDPRGGTPTRFPEAPEPLQFEDTLSPDALLRLVHALDGERDRIETYLRKRLSLKFRAREMERLREELARREPLSKAYIKIAKKIAKKEAEIEQAARFPEDRVQALIRAGFLAEETDGRLVLTLPGRAAVQIGPGGILLSALLFGPNGSDYADPARLAVATAAATDEKDEDLPVPDRNIRLAATMLREHGIPVSFAPLSAVRMNCLIRSDFRACAGDTPGDLYRIAQQTASVLRNIAHADPLPQAIRSAAHRALERLRPVLEHS